MKRVISTVNEDVVSTNDVSGEKIYAFRGSADWIYKLHCVLNDRDNEENMFAFISMNDSDSWTESEYSSMKEAIQAQTADVFEFDSLKEFCMWCLK